MEKKNSLQRNVSYQYIRMKPQSMAIHKQDVVGLTLGGCCLAFAANDFHKTDVLCFPFTSLAREKNSKEEKTMFSLQCFVAPGDVFF